MYKNFERKKLIINVSGEIGTGKSSLCFLLKKFLKENGFSVVFDGGIDYIDESQFDHNVDENLSQKINNIKKTKDIILKEVQLNRY